MGRRRAARFRLRQGIALLPDIRLWRAAIHWAIVIAMQAAHTLLTPVVASADTVRAAVATNFAEPIAALAEMFKAETGHDVLVSTGATGALYAQIVAGAPLDILLAADDKRPKLLETGGQGVAGTRFTYARGRLALWSADPARVGGNGEEALKQDTFRALAIADPAVAPYGVAARETLTSLGLWDKLEARVVYGKNIGQTHALVATGNAELGFVALSHVRSVKGKIGGSHWIVPEQLHAPILQDAILVTTAADNAAARAFLAFLRGSAARAMIERFGYDNDGAVP
ncbi:MAG: molybdate ABC transporter substrate-binding protein [Caldilineaceae bacterium]|nr:molybdate ABC transporter substrate-binding protein [Caldilineaceae bacterium]